MEKISEMINRFPDSEVSEIKTFLFSKTVYVTPDTNGRVVLIPSILSYAQIEKNVVIVGVGNHVEIWSDTLWEREESERNLESIRSKLASIGL
jgi:MraZ protein